MAIQEIAPGVFVETEHLGSNNAIVSTRGGLVLIDAPHRPTDAMAWRRTAAAMGEVVYLINTDHHIDHTMSNHFLAGMVVSHEIARSQLVENAPTPDYVRELVAVIDSPPPPPAADPRLRCASTDHNLRRADGARCRQVALRPHAPARAYA